MTPEARARIAIVLVRARNPANIGAVARAMQDFGFSDLRVVNDYPVPLEAARSAVDAASLLASARQPRSVAEAVEDCALVLGTTAVGDRALIHPLDTLAAATSRIAQSLTAHTQNVAILFGSEKTGLSNSELSHCQALLTIPMHQPVELPTSKHLSMNLGQAVAVCLYAISQSTLPIELPSQPTPATAAELERIFQLLLDVLQSTGYSKRHPANSREIQVREQVIRLGLSHTDAPLWTGQLRQILHHARQPNLGDSDKQAGA